MPFVIPKKEEGMLVFMETSAGINRSFRSSSQAIHDAFVSGCLTMLLFVSLGYARNGLSQKTSFL